MSAEVNKAIVRRYLEQVLRAGRADLVEEFMEEDVTLHGTGLPPGSEAVAAWVTAMSAAFGDQSFTIDDLLADGDRVTVRTTFSGTHQGELYGIPASGARVSQPSISIFRLANGKIAEAWYAADNLSMMQQLGAIPAPQAA